MSGQIAGYVRVSSTDQNPDRQLAAVGLVDELFTDRVSGKSRAGRPALAKLLRHVRRGDTVRVSSMDRLARSVIDPLMPMCGRVDKPWNDLGLIATMAQVLVGRRGRLPKIRQGGCAP